MKGAFAAIQVGLRSKVTSMKIRGSKNIIQFLKELEKDGLIRGFQILDYRKLDLCVFFKYKENLEPLIKQLQSYSETKERIYLKGKHIKLLNNNLDTTFITSKFGMLRLDQFKSQNKVLNYKIGGELKYTISLNKKNNSYKELIKK